ncbi:6-phosphogluconolactonase [Fulvivirga sediminis]|uniref:6-phosphogluconolactonase n=1 Tax=Fulvivirga sediminis TaxID=2803949 RepID=A0A937FCD4_9BACT|nr:6-phosphogluconolactonase [Fulvivirga sediminis]MBL3658604.1 6-phosphogluconolactonase [Fulvivirga sediminis]
MIKVYNSQQEASEAMAEEFKNIANQSIKERGRFNVSLTGGSSPKVLYKLLAEKPLVDQIPWDKTFVFWGDERCVPFDHEDNNAKMAFDLLLDKVPLPKDNTFRMDGRSNPSEGAQEYERILKQHFKNEDPAFDLILLGMGGDGHTASIFPGTEVINEKDKWVDTGYNAELKSDRITLTAPFINKARNIFFGAFGEGKAETLKSVIEGDYRPSEYPSQLINTEQGNLVWYLDEPAAKQIKH